MQSKAFSASALTNGAFVSIFLMFSIIFKRASNVTLCLGFLKKNSLITANYSGVQSPGYDRGIVNDPDLKLKLVRMSFIFYFCPLLG